MSGEPSTPLRQVVGVKLSGEKPPAPVVILKAAGEQAAHVVEQASASGEVPIVRAPELTSKLYRVPLDQSGAASAARWMARSG